MFYLYAVQNSGAGTYFVTVTNPAGSVVSSNALLTIAVPPVLVITGPTNSTVNVAVLQLTGYSSEALSGISYDLSNAVATVTNQQVLITGQDYDTVNMEYTTNYFHGYDIPLTNGLNVITLHATDQAGNVATLTTNFTLDYSSKTNPPDVTVTWPPNGASLAGSSFNLTGQVSDPTATVSVQLVDTNGTTNVYSGVVGRDGQFYVMNLPLTGGTNTATLIVQDAVGNTRSAFFSLAQSAVNLTINPVAAGQATVTGSVSAGCTVTANGVAASVSGTSWTAQIPPIGLGGGSVTVTALSSTGQTNQIQIFVAAPQGVFEQSYHMLESWADGPMAPNKDTGAATLNWTNGVGGYYEDDENGEQYEEKFWPAVSWPDTDYPTGIDLLADEDANGNPIWDTNTFEANPPLPWEHGDRSLILDVISIHQTTDTEIMLATGGSPGSTQQNLWVISATAAAHTNLNDTAGEAIPPTQIQFAGLGTLGSDGNLYLLLPDGVTNTITPKVNGTNDYTFNVWATKYHGYIGLATSTTNANLDTATPEVCVGQTVTLAADWQNGLPPYAYVDNIWWHLPDKYVNQQTNYSSTCVTYVQNVNLFTNTAIQCWYINGPGGTCSVRESLRFTNGQSVNIVAKGNLSVFRPKVDYLITATNTVVGFTTNDGIYLGVGVGYGNTTGDMDWAAHLVNNFKIYDGISSYLQLINTTDLGYTPQYSISTSGSYFLDNDGRSGQQVYDNTNETGARLFYNDAPGTDFYVDTYAARSDNFLTYIQFLPDGGIPVTIGLVTWDWAGEAKVIGGNWSQTFGKIGAPQLNASIDSYPLWSQVYTNSSNNN
jgi:hypothetical protein